MTAAEAGKRLRQATTMDGEWAGTDFDCEFDNLPTFIRASGGQLWVVVLDRFLRGSEPVICLRVQLYNEAWNIRIDDGGARQAAASFSNAHRMLEEVACQYSLPEVPLNLLAMLFVARGW